MSLARPYAIPSLLALAFFVGIAWSFATGGQGIGIPGVLLVFVPLAALGAAIFRSLRKRSP